jgi:alpha-L-rhamnosidase
LGKEGDAKLWAEMVAATKAAFNARFYNAQLGQYDNGSQTSCVLPLAFGLVPQDEESRVFERLVLKITNETHNHIGTGLIGGQFLNRVLTERGRADLAYAMASQRDYPSWGYMISKGATTIWELWNGDTADPAMNSGNHVMLVGDLVIWLYESLAGIRPDDDRPGFKHVIMRPEPVGDLAWVKAGHLSPYGRIASSWQREDGKFDWQITVPVNATATVFVPAARAEAVTESSQPAAEAADVKFLRMEGDRAVFEIGSGDYHFVSQ